MSGANSVRVPISADATGVRQALEQVQAAINSVAKGAKTFGDLDLSHPELRDLAKEIRQIEANLTDMRKTARGSTAAAVRAIYDGSSLNLFGPGGMLTEGLDRRFPDRAERDRVTAQAGRYILQGTRFVLPTPATPAALMPLPAAPGQGASHAPKEQSIGEKFVQSRLGGMASHLLGRNVVGAGVTGAEVGAGAGLAVGGPVGALAGGVIGGVGALLAAKAISAISSNIGAAYQAAAGEAKNTDTLGRTLRDSTHDFFQLRDAVAAATQGLWLTNQEAGRLAISWTRLTNDTSADRVMANVRLAAGVARGYGIDPTSMVQGLGRAQYLGQDPRRFALLIGEAVREGGQTGQVEQVMQALLSWSQTASRVLVTHTNVADFAAMYSGMNATGMPGFKGDNAVALINQINSAVMQGGAGGMASMALAYRAFARQGISDPYQIQYQLQGGAFEHLPGSSETNFELLRGQVNQTYGALPGAMTQGSSNYYRRLAALASEFGINMRQAEGLDKFQYGDIGRAQAVLNQQGISLDKLNPTAIGEIAETLGSHADLNAERTKLLGRDDLSDAEKKSLQGASGEDLRTLMIKLLGEHGTQQDDATRLQQSLADVANAMTASGRGLIPVAIALKDKISDLTAVAGRISTELGELLDGKTNPAPQGQHQPGGYVAPDGSFVPDAAVPASPQPSIGSHVNTDLSNQKLRDQASLAVAYFISQGKTRAQAEGIVANGIAESGLDAHAVGDNGQAYGVFQWHPDRQAQFEKLFGHSIKNSTLQEQLAFKQWELTHTESTAGATIAAAKTAYQAAVDDSLLDQRPAGGTVEAMRRGILARRLQDKLIDGLMASNPSSRGTRLPASDPTRTRVDLGSVSFAPLRVVHETSDGLQLGDEYLPGTHVPPATPLGFGQ